MAPQSARRDRKNQGFPPCYPSTLMGDLDPVRELPYGLAAHELHQEAGQMAASDQVSDQPKNRLRSGGRLAAHELHQEAGQMAASDQVSDQPKNRLRSGGRPQM